jgi:hypothetical protein
MNTFSPSFAKVALVATMLGSGITQARYTPEDQLVRPLERMTPSQMCIHQGSVIMEQLTPLIRAKFAASFTQIEYIHAEIDKAIKPDDRGWYELKMIAQYPDGTSAEIHKERVNIKFPNEVTFWKAQVPQDFDVHWEINCKDQ